MHILFVIADSINICYGLIDLLILQGLDIHMLGRKRMLGSVLVLKPYFSCVIFALLISNERTN